MSFFVYHRTGSSERDPAISSFDRLLDELKENPEDEEHTSISVIHESEWGLGCYLGGYVTFEHVEGEGEPRHMRELSRGQVLLLMRQVANGELAEVEKWPWKPGY